MRDRFDIFGAVIRIRKLSLLLVATLRMPNRHLADEMVMDLAPVDKLPRVSVVHDLQGT